MTISKPFFSLILPTYNVASYIERCIESCKNQSFEDFEIIVIDDLGQDASINIAINLSKTDNRIKIVKNEKNLGTFAARNRGIVQSSGKYIIFLDPDDALRPDTLEHLFKSTKQTPADILLFGRQNIPASRFREIPKLSDRLLPVGLPLITLFSDNPKAYWGTPGKAYLREVAIKACQEFNSCKQRLTYSEDVLFLFCATLHADNYISISDKLYLYHTNPESITATKDYDSLLHLRKQIDLVKEHTSRLISKHRPNLSKNQSEQILDTIHRQLDSDKELLLRFERDPKTKRSLYVTCAIKSFKARKHPKDIIRLLIYYFSLSIVKI